jgi:hypothetical protein
MWQAFWSIYYMRDDAVQEKAVSIMEEAPAADPAPELLN